MTEFAVTVIGRDRPGIIADVTGALAALGVNLTDSSMTLLRGHFAMTLICTGDTPLSDVERVLAPTASDGSLLVSVRAVTDQLTTVPAGEPYVLTLHGADKLGLVAAATRELATAGGNITDATTRLTGELYLLIVEVTLPPDADVPALGGRLGDLGRRLGVDITFRPAEPDVL